VRPATANWDRFASSSAATRGHGTSRGETAAAAKKISASRNSDPSTGEKGALGSSGRDASATTGAGRRAARRTGAGARGLAAGARRAGRFTARGAAGRTAVADGALGGGGGGGEGGGEATGCGATGVAAGAGGDDGGGVGEGAGFAGFGSGFGSGAGSGALAASAEVGTTARRVQASRTVEALQSLQRRGRRPQADIERYVLKRRPTPRV